jgi:hypothetical protein
MVKNNMMKEAQYVHQLNNTPLSQTFRFIMTPTINHQTL